MVAYITTANIGTIGVLTVLDASIYVQSTLIDISTCVPIRVQGVTNVAATNIRFKSIVTVLRTLVDSFRALIDICT